VLKLKKDLWHKCLKEACRREGTHREDSRLEVKHLNLVTQEGRMSLERGKRDQLSGGGGGLIGSLGRISRREGPK